MSTPNKFYALLESTVPDPQRLEDINKKPLSETNYLICFTPRSGSTLLTEVLSATGIMGYPEEYFNANDIMPQVLKGKLSAFLPLLEKGMPCNNVTDYVNILRRECSTPNGFFGCEVDFFQLELILEKANLSVLFGDNLLFISLIREDFISQAISLYKSVKSGLWHTLNYWGNVQHKLGDFVKKDSEIEYNREEIKQWVMHILQQEYSNEKLFKSMGINPLRLTYEKLVADTLGCVKEIATYIGVTLPDRFSISKTRNEKVGTSLNEQFKERFMAEEEHFVRVCHKLRGTVPTHLIEKEAEKLLNQTTNGQQSELVNVTPQLKRKLVKSLINMGVEGNQFAMSGSIFTLPKRVKPPHSWVEHIPFAFFLIHTLKPKILVELGVYVGNSYNAFCQAVSILNTATQCYGIDTWRGDEHANFYDESVYNELFAYQQREYPEFSFLLRHSFDEMLESFEDHSIDLLHIDGFHTYDAVKHDFDSWLPKVSDQGVVIFHDTEVREQDFGVWLLWEELAQTYPSFNFKHGYGLGVIAVGTQVPPEFLNFLQAANQEPFYRELFARLGHYITVLEQNKTLEKSVPAQHLFAQLFVDTGKGFEERHSIIKTVTGEESQLAFDLSGYDSIKQLRFDPLNTLVIVRIPRIVLIDQRQVSHELQSYEDNALVCQAEKTLVFDTDDSLIYLDLQNYARPQRIVFFVEYVAIGTQALSQILKLERDQRQTLEQQNQDFSQNLENPKERKRTLKNLLHHHQIPTRYLVQLFIDTGSGFSEEQSMIQAVTEFTENEQQFEFDLSGYENLKHLRFDPLNTLTALRIEQIVVVDGQGLTHQLNYQPVNTYAQLGEILVFDTQ